MNRKIQLSYRMIPLGLIVATSLAGCQTAPNNATQGALFGGLLGAGTGAVVGHALGNTGAGAAVGAGVGALSGAAIGSAQDQSEARNRALIGRQVAGAATIADVVSMTHSNVDEGLIINHVRSHGLAAPLQASDVIYLQQENVSRNVIIVMQQTPVAVAAQPVPVYSDPPSGGVIVEERWGPGYYRPYHRNYY